MNYTPRSGRRPGLTTFGANQTDFAGTEAEFSALQSSDPNRGYQYIPDVAGAVAMMYKVKDKANRPVDYLRLSRLTVAKIFMGYISRWSDPAISADNSGLVLPDEAINVVYRAGQSGTTALFYDFVQKTDPSDFAAVGRPQPAADERAHPVARPVAGLRAQDPGVQRLGPDRPVHRQQHRHVEHRLRRVLASPSTTRPRPPASRTPRAPTSLPYAQNISSALEGAKLNPDLSQELSGVYNSPKADAYPISAYSYIVTQCAPAADRPTCKGAYSNPGVTETLSKWLRYIACEGQIQMANIGYSPLPPNLSQEVANSIGRMAGDGTGAAHAGQLRQPPLQGADQRADPTARPAGDRAPTSLRPARRHER